MIIANLLIITPTNFWACLKMNCKVQRSYQWHSRGDDPGQMPPWTYACIARDLLTFVANFNPGGLDWIALVLS